MQRGVAWRKSWSWVSSCRTRRAKLRVFALRVREGSRTLPPLALESLASRDWHVASVCMELNLGSSDGIRLFG